MKKILLIPSLLTVGVMPMVSMVGCGNNNKETWDVQWSLEDGQPTWPYEQPTKSYKSLEEAEDAYFSSITSKFMAQDIFIFYANAFWEHKDDYESAEIKVKVNSINRQKQRISFVVDVARVGKGQKDLESMHIRETFVNVPVEMYYADHEPEMPLRIQLCDTDKFPTILPDSWANDHEWSFIYLRERGGVSTIDTINYEVKGDEQYHLATLEQLSLFFYRIFYFKNVTIDP